MDSIRNLNIKRKIIFYIALSIIFVTSLASATLLPAGALRALAFLPGVGALFGALIQVLRDRVAYERSLLLLEAQNAFSLGATSHMASVAFDKHVAFCEAYVAEMFETLSTFFREGPTEDALKHSGRLYSIRQKWALWVTPDIEKELERFEQAVREIGAHAHLLQAIPGEQASIQKMFSLFAQVVGFKEWGGAPLTPELAVTTIIAGLRKALGIEELTGLRTKLVSRAIEQLSVGCPNWR